MKTKRRDMLKAMFIELDDALLSIEIHAFRGKLASRGSSRECFARIEAEALEARKKAEKMVAKWL